MEEPRIQTASKGPGEWQHEGVVYLPVTTPTILESIPKWPLHPDDVIIAGYPKSGNSWTHIVVSAILRADRIDTFEEEGMDGLLLEPIEFTTLDQATKLSRPNIFFTHLLPDRLPTALRTKKNKVIHVMRNPNDVAVSYYHFHRTFEKLGFYKGSWNDFFPYFINGNVVYRSCYDHIKRWIRNCHNMNVKHIYYEDMVYDPTRMVKDLAVFLGRSLNDQQVNEIVWKTSFQKMKEYSHLNADPDCRQDISPFLRRGKVGDWKNYFNDEEKRQAEEKYQKLVEETGITFRFE